MMEGIRGFSYMAEMKIEVPGLQYIEGSELERTWRSTQRERAKQREQKIWEEFVREQDAVTELCKDDPYQFLEQLPQEYLQELMQRELKKMQKEEEEIQEAKDNLVEEIQDAVDQVEEERTSGDQPAVTFADDQENYNMFHIFDDENDVSGPEDEVLNESLETPCTVREKNEDQPVSIVSTNTSSDFEKHSRSGKSENVTNLIESGIYCAKAKDLRLKINAELLAIIESMKNKSFVDIEREDLVKMKRRSTEFCNRFNRIHLYQLQRQLHDLNRHNSQSLPYAKHTQFQSQMVRVVALYQNILQALLVFHKSLQQTSFLSECAASLAALTELLRGVRAAAPRPPDAASTEADCDDDTLETCDKFESALKDYSERVAEMLSSYDTTCNNPQRSARSNQNKGNLGGKKKPQNPGNVYTKTNSESKLSMYAMDAKPLFRINLHPKQSASKLNNNPSGTSLQSKQAGTVTTATSNTKSSANSKNKEPPKSGRKTPRSRRPLMRAPGGAGEGRGGTRGAGRAGRDADVHTMVEAVGTCKSGPASPESSPKRSDYSLGLKSPKTYRSKDSSPRALNLTPRSGRTNITPRSKESPRIQQRPNTKLSPLRNMKPLNLVEGQGSVMSPLKSISRTVKEDYIPEEPNDLDTEVDPAIAGTIRVQTRMKSTKDATRATENSPRKQEADTSDCEVSRILKSLCAENNMGVKNDRKSTGAKNAQLICINGSGSRQTSTPQLLRILEETIQKKSPRQLINQKPLTEKQKERLRLSFNIQESTADSLFQYRTRFVQHMLASPMYANSAIGKPWEVIGSVSDKIIDSLLLKCAKEMELQDVLSEMYENETH